MPRHSTPPDQLSERTRFRLLQDPYRLLKVELLLLHGECPSWAARFCWSLTFKADQETEAFRSGGEKILFPQANHPRAHLAVACANYARRDALFKNRLQAEPDFPIRMVAL